MYVPPNFHDPSVRGIYEELLRKLWILKYIWLATSCLPSNMRPLSSHHQRLTVTRFKEFMEAQRQELKEDLSRAHRPYQFRVWVVYNSGKGVFVTSLHRSLSALFYRSIDCVMLVFSQLDRKNLMFCK